jgi:hypothetical protein
VQLPVILADIEGDTALAVLLDADAIARLRGTRSDLKGRVAFRAARLGLMLPDTPIEHASTSGAPLRSTTLGGYVSPLRRKRSPAMRCVLELADRAAPTDSNRAGHGQKRNRQGTTGTVRSRAVAPFKGCTTVHARVRKQRRSRKHRLCQQ